MVATFLFVLCGVVVPLASELFRPNKTIADEVGEEVRRVVIELSRARLETLV